MLLPIMFVDIDLLVLVSPFYILLIILHGYTYRRRLHRHDFGKLFVLFDLQQITTYYLYLIFNENYHVKHVHKLRLGRLVISRKIRTRRYEKQLFTILYLNGGSTIFRLDRLVLGHTKFGHRPNKAHLFN